jgi:hypothetical protein
MSDETDVVNVEAAIFGGDTWLMILRRAFVRWRQG